MARQMLVGSHQSKQSELADTTVPTQADTESAFVAIDLLVIDGESIVDVPLLERKRLLESILDEGPLVRVGVHVRAPIDPWLVTWRAAGFRALAWKHANSRYHPGEANEDWAIGPIPKD
jgi:ATP-dependent DNA ligase